MTGPDPHDTAHGNGSGSPAEQRDVVATAAAERRAVPGDAVEAADLADKYDRMMRLAALFDAAGEQMRERSRLGTDILSESAFTDSAPLAGASYVRAEDDISVATTGRNGLLARSIELDADALILRATVLTYRWIDELQEAAYQTIGQVAARAIGYLAPEVALGGAIVSAGLIETDALDRDGVADYLGELAEANPELLHHVTSGGGGLVDGLRMASLLTAGVLATPQSEAVARGGLRAIGVPPMGTGLGPALRDVAGHLVDEHDDLAETPDSPAPTGSGEGEPGAPRSLTELMTTLRETHAVSVRQVAPHRYIAFVPGETPAPGQPRGTAGTRRLRLVGGDGSGRAGVVRRRIERAVDGDADARVMLVGAAQGGAVAVEVAAAPASTPGTSASFVVDQVVTAGAPSAHVPRIPDPTRVLSLEDRGDPVALLGSLINAGVPNRVTVAYERDPGSDDDGVLAGARAVDHAQHPELRAEIARITDLGYLARD